jgi:hypothetical protein
MDVTSYKRSTPFHLGSQMFNAEVSVGNVIAVGAVLISAAGVIATLAKERALKTKELADKVRQSAALIAAKLDRWKQLGVHSFNLLQAAATDADGLLVEKDDQILTRDFFWKEVVSAQSDLVRRVLEEEIEIAYSDLFGYDPKVHELYTEAIKSLREIQRLIFIQVLNRTQSEILEVSRGSRGKFMSAQLGNRLRYRLAESQELLEGAMELIVGKFRIMMSTLICSPDEVLVKRSFRLPDVGSFPTLEELRETIHVSKVSSAERCSMIFSGTRRSPLGPMVLDPWARPRDQEDEDSES